MKKIRDPITGAIRYIKSEEDISKLKLINRVAALEKKIKILEETVLRLLSEGHN